MMKTALRCDSALVVTVIGKPAKDTDFSIPSNKSHLFRASFPPKANDDDISDLLPPPGPDDPETLWGVAKKNYG